MNKHAQSIVEYVLIAVLVILGVVVMGPYVLRSVSAHFKLWDESVKDSFDESLHQAPVGDLPVINTPCICIDTPGDCGSNLAGAQCGANQRIMNHTCPPPSVQECDRKPLSSCQPDDKCCQTYNPNGCGNVPIPSTGIPSGNTPPTPTNCYYGQRIWSTLCSDLPIECRGDSTCPVPACHGPYPPDPTVNLFCATHSINPPTGLGQDYPISYVTACPGSGATCQMYCVPPNVIDSTTNPTGCVAPPAQPIQCSEDRGNGTFNNGKYTGSFSGNVQGTSCGTIDISLSCNSNSTLGGICITADNCGQDRTGSGKQPSCPASPNSISCSQSITFYYQPPPSSGGTCPNGGGCTSANSPSYTLNCSGGQLTSIINNQSAGIPPAAVNGCNWSGSQTINDFGRGNDMTFTCTPNSNGQGVLTNFTYDV